MSNDSGSGSSYGRQGIDSGSEEELPSLSNSPGEVETRENNEENLTSSEEPEDNLRSEPSPSPSFEELLSVHSNSPGNNSAVAVPSPEGNSLPDQGQSMPEQHPQPSTSSAGGGGTAPGRTNIIRSFKSRIDENGETVFEFASDEGESSEEEPDVPLPTRQRVGEAQLDYDWVRMRRIPVGPITIQSDDEDEDYATSRARYRGNISTDMEDDEFLTATLPDSYFSDDLEYSATDHGSYRVVAASVSRPQENSDSDDPDYSPRIATAGPSGSSTSIAHRMAGRRSGGYGPGHVLGSQTVLTHLGTIRQLQVGSTSARRAGRGGVGVGRRRKRRKARVAKPKKPAIPRVQKPPKPLLPKTIVQNENGNETAELYRSEVSARWGHRSNINFTLMNDEDNSHYTVGDVLLRIDNPADLQALQAVDREMLLNKFPGLKNMTLHISDSREFGIIQLTTEETLADEEASQRPVPRLSGIDMRRKLIFVVKKMYLFSCHVEGFPMKLFTSAGFGNKTVFRLDFVDCCDERGNIQLDILIPKSFIFGPHDLNEIPYTQHKMIADAFNILFKVELPAGPGHDATGQKDSEDIPWFYGQIKKYHDKEVLPSPAFSLQPQIVGPTLRPYQRDAVKWMLYREGALSSTNCQSGDEITPRVNLRDSFFEKMYVPVLIGGKSAFYNPYIGYLSWTYPEVAQLPFGGILADEMGLGKTVEVICLVLLNPRPIEDYKQQENNFSDAEKSSVSSSYGQDSDASSVSRTSTEEESDFEYTQKKKNHKRKSKRKNKTQPKNKLVKRARRIESDSDDTESEPVQRTNLRRGKRSISPCTYLTKGSRPEEVGESHAKMNCSFSAASTSKSKLNRNAFFDPKTGIAKKLLRTSEPTTTYEKLKAIYDSQLLSYTESLSANRPRFHGTFFDTKIARIARFECICGGTNDDHRNEIATCSSCFSSQHAECVGFSKELQRRFTQQKIDYLCPHCITLNPPYQAKSTLIVTPDSISHQWINELQRHINKQNMSILFYKGVSHQDYIPPAKLAEFDIVVTTYTTLTSELNYTDLPHMNGEDGRRFRYSKRFMTIPSPLPCVGWWRVCLDEAQMVEGISSKMSLMAMKLQAVQRWCITGTPINEGLNDLFGLFAFLGVEPVALDFWWQKLVQTPFYQKEVSLLFELFGQMIWRMDKISVLDQLGIPPQSSMVNWLTFSAVEDHFYKQQFEICSAKIVDKISRLRQTNSNILESRLSALDRKILQSLLQPFLDLRKACCHPQMVKGQSISLHKGTITMEELLAQLIKKTGMQCAEDHRQIVASLNGMAGIHMINEEWLPASERYREVLQSAGKNKEHFQTDSLQLLHTMENLADLLDRNHDGIPYTLRDGTLRSEAEVLKQKYLEKHANSVKSARTVAEPLTQLAEELSTQFNCSSNGASWWVRTLSSAAKIGKIDEFVQRIKLELVAGPDGKQMKQIISMANKFNDANSLERVLIENILEIEKLRKKALEGLQKLQHEDPSSFIDAAVSCHLRKKSQLYYKESDELGFRCDLCQHHDKFIKYESLLFKENKKVQIIRTGRKWQQHKLMGEIAPELTEEELNLLLLKEEEDLIESLEHVNVGISNDLRHGTWGDSDTEKTLKLIKNFARINRLAKEVRDDASTHIKLFEAMKKEFRVLRILWRQIFDQISAHDELSQATTRLCLTHNSAAPDAANNDDEPGPSNSTGNSRRKQKKPKQLLDTRNEQNQRLQNINVLEHHELATKNAQMQTELDIGKESLALHMGQLLYLETLKKKDYGKKGEVNLEDCPVCQLQLGQEWVVLPCGHSYCLNCVKTMCPKQNNFLCPLCRVQVKYSELSFVDTKAVESSSPSKSATKTKSIKGSHSTKVTAIVEMLLEIQETHPGEKVIVFSTWIDVLEIISKALGQNDIINCLLTQSGKKFQIELERFKKNEDIQVLLMPLASGSKGLNIIEATHILLVEPILSKASELQAIGRVHRIGQTKPTFIHKFYVKNTIEEQLCEVLKTHDVSSDSEGSLTVADLHNLIRDGQNYAGSNLVTLD